jgi:ATP-binding cassette subfamily B protein
MSLRQLLAGHLVGPYRRALLLVVVLQAVQTTATLMLPNLNSNLIDEGVLQGDNDYIIRVGAVMLGFALVQIVFAAAAVRVGARASMGFGRDVRRDLFEQVTTFSAHDVAQFGAPSLITRITNDVQQVQVLVVLATTMMISAPLTMVIGMFLAMQEDLGLSVVLAVAIPAAVVILGLVIVQMVPAVRLMQERVDRVNGVLREQITGIRVVRAFVREPQERERFTRANADLTEVALRSGRLMSTMFPTVGLILNMSSLAVLWLGADRIQDGAMEMGSLVAYLSYLIQVLMSVVMLTIMASMIPRAGVAADRIVEVLDTETSLRPPKYPVRDLGVMRGIEYDAVSFCYPGAEHAVLSNIDLTVDAGRTTAVIGSTGSGKTTLVNLALRLFDPTSGTVRVHGVDARDLDPDLLWGRIGYVPQRGYLFSGTIASNLRFGRPDASDEELWTALEIAQAAGFVQSMPEGLDSPIHQGGTNVSGGQRQRLAIARALVARPDIYVFDDSFSALDLATDARVRAALRHVVADAAVLIVAQRVSTIRDADQIVVLEDGEIVGRGTYDELLTTCPTFLEIVESQLGEGAVA